MKWLNAIKRAFHLEESPPAVSGDTSVLFCLQHKSPMTLGQLLDSTKIPPGDLRLVLDRMEVQGRVRAALGFANGRADVDRLYWIVPTPNRNLIENGDEPCF
jgi:selenocysteine lyase/cysteine desulfurase